MHPTSTAFLERAFTFWDVFAGKVISCRVGLCKPEPAIYAHLLERYALAGPETVFIDDLEVNLAAAAAFGIQTIKFEDPAQCARALRALGVEWT
jgi:putative hydrolase of the HAD superfamily